MKQVLTIVAALAFGLFSCNDDKDGHSTGHADSTGSKNIDIYKQTLKAIETGDSATLAKLISSDAVDHAAGENGADITGAEVVHDLAEVHTAIDDLKMDLEQVASNGDYVFGLVRMTGTTKSGIWGMPANTKVDTRSVDVVKMKDGKATDHWTYVSPAEMMKAMQPTVKDSVSH